MKRKYKESIDSFSIIEQKYTLNDFLRPIFYQYRAYGYFCLSMHKKAYEDYCTFEKLHGNLQNNSKYNKFLCEGIINV